MLNKFVQIKKDFWKKFSRTRKSWRFASTLPLLLGAIAFTIALTTPYSAWGQAELFSLNWIMGNRPNDAAQIDHAVVRLDGYQLFLLAAPAANQQFPLEQRSQGIEEELNRIVSSNFNGSGDPDNLAIEVVMDEKSEQPTIEIGDRYLMTVTTIDAQLQGRDPQGWANQIVQILRDALIRAKQERQPQFLLNRSVMAMAIIAAIFVGLKLITHWQWRLKRHQEAIESRLENEAESNLEVAAAQDLQHQLTQQQKANLRDLQCRALELTYVGILGGGTFIVLGLFPYSRWLQSFLLSTPLQVMAIAFLTYLLIRISNLLIERFSGFLKAREFAMLKPYQRMDLRVSTVSRVLKNVAGIIWFSLGFLTILSSIGFDLVPLLAGAGIIGLAISFAAQGLIKDVINGFLIILEDQYAVGDVIVIGDLGGLVENMNLRVTQIRNNEGQLITIPNSSISIVQNLSKDWARVDLTIRVAYATNPDQALDILKNLSNEIYQEPIWRAKIIDPPEVLGIDDLQHSGMLIRIWIKTQPLQQWAVSREFRRRLKLRMEEEGLEIGIPQQVTVLASGQSQSLAPLELQP
ncbi:MAG: mechanosensitive ion channel protein MscS [Pseudanabaena sp.]|nr:MAG: mechanosensitive ion channel protein MscS [Pseudanabaena sp.]